MSALLLVSLILAPLQAADKPNFVWLISEDNSVHYLKLFDAHGAATPRIEQMAQQGILFEHAFSNSPVCSVARTTLITGCFAPRIGTQYHRRSKLAAMPDGLRMFPAYLREAGYYTSNNRKKDYNAVEGTGVWDESSNRASWRNREPGQPFFHKQSFSTTHESSLHFNQKTMDTERTSTDPDSVFVAPYHPDTPTFRYTVARYHDRIGQMDQQIGGVLDQLEEEGLLEDTFVFYFGDHGGVLPRGKGYAYESGLHVPLVVRIPLNWKHLVDADRGSRTRGFVSFVDFGPTLLQLAGLQIPPQVDGQPFLGPGISRAEVAARDESFGYADRFDEKYDLVRTLRKGRFEYIRNFQPFNFDGLQNNYRYRMLAYAQWRRLFQQGQLNDIQSQFFRRRPAEQLFDISADPHETRNLAEDPQYADVLERLRQRLVERMTGMPDLSLIPENVLFDEALDNATAFGQRHQADITDMIRVANLCLQPFPDARADLANALKSEHQWIRYWACIALSSFGEPAAVFERDLRQMMAEDPNRLVRVRAAECLGLLGLADPRPAIMTALKSSPSPVEAGLILNSVVLLQDGKPAYDFGVTREWFQQFPLGRSADTVERRLQYLAPR